MPEQNVNLSFDQFQGFMHTRASTLAMDVELCDLADLAPDWQMSSKELARPDRGFFTVSGVRVLRAAGREVTGWAQPMFAYQTAGYVGLIVCKMADLDVVLVRLMAEPGNVGVRNAANKNTRVLVCPSIQFSQGNLAQHEKAKRGELDKNGHPIKPVPFADAVTGSHYDVQWQPAPEDGGRFFEKVNNYGLIRVACVQEIQTDLEATGMMENYSWVSVPVLRDLCRLGLVSGHLRSCMSLLV